MISVDSTTLKTLLSTLRSGLVNLHWIYFLNELFNAFNGKYEEFLRISSNISPASNASLNSLLQ